MFTLHWLPLIVGICVCVSAQDVTSRWLLTYTLRDYNATDRPGGWLGCTTVWTRPCSVCTPLASTSRLARDSVRPASSSASLSTSHRWAEQACSAQQWLFLYRPKHYVGQVEHRNIIGKKLQSAQNDLMQTSDDKNENEKKLTKIVQVSSDKEMCRAHQPARTSDDIPVKMTTEDDIGNLKSLTKALDSAIIPLRWIYFFVVSKGPSDTWAALWEYTAELEDTRPTDQAWSDWLLLSWGRWRSLKRTPAWSTTSFSSPPPSPVTSDGLSLAVTAQTPRCTYMHQIVNTRMMRPGTLIIHTDDYKRFACFLAGKGDDFHYLWKSISRYTLAGHCLIMFQCELCNFLAQIACHPPYFLWSILRPLFY